MLYDIGIVEELLNKTPKAQETKAKIEKWNCIKLKASAYKGNK
jgi:hypothetical protein